MGSTTPWALPYPAPGDHTRTWEYWQSLAEASNTALNTLKADTTTAINQAKDVRQPHFHAITTTSQLLTGAPVQYPLTTLRFGNGVRLVGGKATVDIAGLYLVIGGAAMYTREAAAAVATGVVTLEPSPIPEYSPWSGIRGAGTLRVHATVTEIINFAVGATIGIGILGASYGASANALEGRLIMYRLGGP